MTDRASEQSIFLHAIELPSATARAAYLDSVCRDNPELRAELEALLDAHDRLGGLPSTGLGGANLNPPEPQPPPSPGPAAEVAGTVLGGRYKLLEQIGEGGMGTVWMAQQFEPIKRLVAIKWIKAGMDSKQVLARFEAERQAVALMDHPNIAKVHDAGSTPDGRPYFVMELVKGQPITKYCDEHHLTPRQRLELFISVCQAIQHAHQKGIIHRDLKPSNVLVALYDGRAVPKVIDFGVAKAAGQPLTEKTLVTGFGNIVGTLEYMSPEQAGINQLDIDTRSDIYSLGVLLYELLTGSPPFSRKELEKAGVLEMLRVIREQEPSKPSTKLSTAEGLPTLAANRGTEPAKLTKLVRGELDWIVMKALEKDRSRRYETANGFAADLQRYLCDEPVQACPPSAGYRLRKFVRRNKGTVLAVSLVVVALLAGLVGTTWGMVWAFDERDAKEQARQVAESNEQKAKIAATEARTAETEARDAEGKARTAEAKERKAREQAQARLAQMDKATWMLGNVLTDAAQSRPEVVGKPVRVYFAERLDYMISLLDVEAIDDPIVLAKIQSTFGSCYQLLGFSQKGIPLLEKAVKTQKAELGPGHRDTLKSMTELANCYRVLRRPSAAVPLHEEMLKVHQDKFGPDHMETLQRMNTLALVYMEARRVPEAVTLVDEVARRCKPDDPLSMGPRAAVYQAAGRLDEALALREELVKVFKDKYGADRGETLSSMADLAMTYQAAGKFDKALGLREEIVRVHKDKFGPDSERTLFSVSSLASAYMAAGRATDALPILTDLVPRLRKKFGIQIVTTQDNIRSLIACHEALGEPARAEPLHRELVDFARQSGPNSPIYATHLASLGRNLLKQNKPALAEPVLRECLTIRIKSTPDLWMTFEAKSLVGAALLDQKKYTDAEPFLVDGYRGLKEREATMPGKIALLDAASRLIRLYDALGNADEAARWRKELEDIQKRIKEQSRPNPVDP